MKFDMWAEGKLSKSIFRIPLKHEKSWLFLRSIVDADSSCQIHHQARQAWVRGMCVHRSCSRFTQNIRCLLLSVEQ